jgi:hypothetical protein
MRCLIFKFLFFWCCRIFWRRILWRVRRQRSPHSE